MDQAIPSLTDLGWMHFGAPKVDLPGRPARVVRQSSAAWLIADGEAEYLATAGSRKLHPVPVTGDWVSVQGADPCVIAAVMPRGTSLSRGATDGTSGEQVIAANVDLVASCVAANAVNPRRMEREIAAIWASGARPLVVLTKSDLVDDIAEVMHSVSVQCPGVDVLAVAQHDEQSLRELAHCVPPGHTLALIGPSGVGKSTLVNGLLGRTAMATSSVRSDGKGRHTTTSRHLLVMPTGGSLLDTPGMRGFAPWTDDEALATTFADIEELASECRFDDCSHTSEPGCHVLLEAEQHPEVAARLEHWRKLQRESAWLARRNDARLQHEEGKRWAALTADARTRIRRR